MPGNKIVNVWLSVRKSRKHPQLIYKHSNGTEITVTLSTLFNNDEEDVAVAKEIYDQKRRQIALGMFDAEKEIAMQRQDMPLHEFERLYLQHRRKSAALNDVSGKTVEEDEKAFRLLKSIMGSRSVLGNIDNAYVNTFVNQLRTTRSRRNAPYSNQTINKALRTLSAAFNYALKKGYVSTNAFAAFGKLKTDRPENYIRVMTDSERAAFQAYFANAKRARWRLPAYLFALNTLCRAGSIVSVRWNDIFTNTVDGKETYFVRLREKRNTVRDVPLFPDALNALQMMRTLAEDAPAYLATTHRDKSHDRYLQRLADGYVFFPITTIDTCSHMMTDASRKLLLAQKIRAKVKFHNLRDTGATYLLENGVPIETVSYMLGHSNITTTQKHYAKVTPVKVARDTHRLRTVTHDSE